MKYLRHINESNNIRNDIKANIKDLIDDLNNHCLDILDISKRTTASYFSDRYLISMTIKVEFDKIDQDVYDSLKAKLELLGDNKVDVSFHHERISSGSGSTTRGGSIYELDYKDISFDSIAANFGFNFPDMVNYLVFDIKYISLSELV